MQFQNRLATLTSVLDDSRSDLDGALNNLSVAIVEVKRFVAGSRAADQRADPAPGQHHPDPGRQQGVAGERPAHRAERVRQRLQHLPPGHRRLRRCVRAAQLLEPDPLRLRCDRRAGERDRPGNGEAVRPVPRPRAATAERQRPHPVRGQPVPDAVGRSRRPWSSRIRPWRRTAAVPSAHRSRCLRCRPSSDPATFRRPPAGERHPDRRQVSWRPKACRPRPSPPLLPDAPVVAPPTVEPAPSLATPPAAVPAPAPAPATLPGVLLPAEGSPPPPAPDAPLPAEGTPGS